MPSDITLIFSKETLSLIDERMHEEGVTNRQAFLAELLTRALTRRDSTRTWENVISRIVSDRMEEDEGTILIYSSDTE